MSTSTISNVTTRVLKRIIIESAMGSMQGVFLQRPISIVLKSMMGMGSLLILGYHLTNGTILVGDNNDYEEVPLEELEDDIDFNNMSREDVAELARLEQKLGIDVPESTDDLLPGSRLVPEHILRKFKIVL
jgi:hypothetical protein